METNISNNTRKGKTPAPTRKPNSLVQELDQLENLYRRAPGRGSIGSKSAIRRKGGDGDTKGPQRPPSDGGDTKGPGDGGDTKGTTKPKVGQRR